MSQLEGQQFSRILIRSVSLPFVLLALLALILLWQINQLLTAKQWVEHTQTVIAAAHKNQKLLVDMETGVRGYLVTGNPVFLEPYDQALPLIESEIERLGHLVADNPSQVARVNEIHETFKKWFEYSRAVIALREQGGNYQEFANSGSGKRLFDQMRQVFAGFIETEEALRDQRTQTTEETVRLAIATTIFLALFLGSLLAVFSRQQLISLSERYAAALAPEQERAEQLRQSQKLEAVGQLAGGVAHDFNNMLTAIIGYSDLALFRLNQADPLRKNIEEIKKAANLAADLTHQLLAFSRKQILQPRVISLNDGVGNIEPMLKRLLGEHIELFFKLAPQAGAILADPGQIEQIVINLAVNARDAMPEGGKLTIETANVFLDEEYVSHHLASKHGKHVMLAVSDTGSGMDEQTKSRIFDPFFTTKEFGKGTGLGLATVYGIVKQSGGNIWVYSEPGRGTTFKIYFPRVEEALDQSISPIEYGERQQGTETILLVEDDDMVRELTVRILEENGYTVLFASNGEDALKQCREYPAEIHLLIADVVMPRIGGNKLAEEVKKLRLEIKVLFISGYTDNAIMHHEILNAEAGFLEKPFTPKTLLYKIREVLSKS